MPDGFEDATIGVPASVLVGVLAEMQQLYDGGAGYDRRASFPSDTLKELLREHWYVQNPNGSWRRDRSAVSLPTGDPT